MVPLKAYDLRFLAHFPGVKRKGLAFTTTEPLIRIALDVGKRAQVATRAVLKYACCNDEALVLIVTYSSDFVFQQLQEMGMFFESL